MDIQELQLQANNICNSIQNMVQYFLNTTHLENSIHIQDETQDTPNNNSHKEDKAMAFQRVKVLTGTDAYGNPIYTTVSGSTQDERNDKIVIEYYKSGRIWQVLGINPLQEIKNHIESKESSKKKKQGHLFTTYSWEYYARYKGPKLQANSKIREKTALNRLCRFFEGKNIEDLTANDVQDFMNEMANEGSSAITISDYVKTLRFVLNCAVEDGIRPDNPAKSSKLSRVGRKTDGTEALTLNEIKRIVTHIPLVKDKTVQLVLALLSLTGMRREEVLGLQWGDVNFESKQIHVQRAIAYPSGKRTIKDTKSLAGNRYIPIPDILVSLLKVYPRRVCLEGDFIILNENDCLLHQNQVDDILDRIRAELKMPNITAKTFRTTYATIMVATNQVTVKELQAIMGHSKIQTTLDIYAKVEKSLLSVKGNVFTDFMDKAAD